MNYSDLPIEGVLERTVTWEELRQWIDAMSSEERAKPVFFLECLLKDKPNLWAATLVRAKKKIAIEEYNHPLKRGEYFLTEAFPNDW